MGCGGGNGGEERVKVGLILSVLLEFRRRATGINEGVCREGLLVVLCEREKRGDDV